MYQTKAIIRHDELIELPGCMYKMKNILSGQKNQSSAGHVSSSPNKDLDLSEQVNKILKVSFLICIIFKCVSCLLRIRMRFLLLTSKFFIFVN